MQPHQMQPTTYQITILPDCIPSSLNHKNHKTRRVYIYHCISINHAFSFTDPSKKRHVLKPIQHPNLWVIFKEQQSVLWTTEEIDWEQDKSDWDTLEPEAKHFHSLYYCFLCRV